MSTPRDYSLTFTGAGSQEIKATGRHVRVYSTSVAGADVWLNIDGTELKRRAGQGVNVGGAGFSRVTVRVAVACTVLICIADERQDDDQENVSVSVSATVGAGNTADNGGDVSILASSSAQVLAADATRLVAIITNPVTNTDQVRVGGAGVLATSGVPLEPGESVSLALTAAIHVFNAKAGGAQTVTAAAVRKV